MYNPSIYILAKLYTKFNYKFLSIYSIQLSISNIYLLLTASFHWVGIPSTENILG